MVFNSNSKVELLLGRYKCNDVVILESTAGRFHIRVFGNGGDDGTDSIDVFLSLHSIEEFVNKFVNKTSLN